MNRKVAVVGLGYVGLPVALAFARKFPGTIGFDIDEEKVSLLNRGIDATGELTSDELRSAGLAMTADPAKLKGADFFVIAVPTPVDRNRNPDFVALQGASEIVGKALSKGAIVVYESTVYPGVTEDICGPVLEKYSGLKQGVDFKLGYSPERINPGDKEHALERVIKVVSAEDRATLDIVAKMYGAIVPVGVHCAPSIKVAEAAKVIENTQRDLNIALMNELSMIFERLGICTSDVLAAAGTKWNFLKFVPGLVGGHCIGVDPYYLTTKAEQLGYHPQVILAGRRINDGMGVYVAQRMVKSMVIAGMQIRGARIGILGLTFKENVSDLRNSRVPDIVFELKAFGIEPLVHDPVAKSEESEHEYGISLAPLSELKDLDGLIFAVSHHAYTEMTPDDLSSRVKKGGVVADIKAALKTARLRPDLTYWSL